MAGEIPCPNCNTAAIDVKAKNDSVSGAAAEWVAELEITLDKDWDGGTLFAPKLVIVGSANSKKQVFKQPRSWSIDKNQSRTFKLPDGAKVPIGAQARLDFKMLVRKNFMVK